MLFRSEGVISWTNDGGLPNPNPVNIKGKDGAKGDKGDKGDDAQVGELQAEIDAINAELDKRFPFLITSFTGGKIAEKGTTQSVNLAWAYDGTPTTQSLRSGSIDYGIAINDRAKTVSNITTNMTFSLTANNKTATQAISFYNCKYVGVVTSAPTTEAGIKALTKLAVSSSKGYTWNGSLDNQRVCYCYPTSFGALSSIKDANGFDYLAGYTRTTVTCNGESYYVYLSGASIVSGFRQVFA